MTSTTAVSRLVPAPVSPLESFGVGARGDRLYRTVLREGRLTAEVLSARLGWDVVEVETELASLVELGLLARSDAVVFAVSPHLALGRLGEDAARNLVERERALANLRAAIPDYAAEERGADLVGTALQPVEVHAGPEVSSVVDALIRSTTGELLLIHTVEWLDRPGWPKQDTLIAREAAGGRGVRSIYPTEALHRPQWLATVRQWAELGEDVRLLPSPKSRLMVFGVQAALVPVEWGSSPTRRVIVRTPGVVDALRQLFEVLWRQGSPVPGTESATDRQNIQVLKLLAAGAKDETIARQMGLSLRTVRRRVAELIGELGATTRFQAGVEAARRRLI
jgi:DNA-binding CsgD family transcriptional regulator